MYETHGLMANCCRAIYGHHGARLAEGRRAHVITLSPKEESNYMCPVSERGKQLHATLAHTITLSPKEEGNCMCRALHKKNVGQQVNGTCEHIHYVITLFD